jgi:hypothetical protein
MSYIITLLDRDKKYISKVTVDEITDRCTIIFPEYSSDKMVFASFVEILGKVTRLTSEIPLHNHFGYPMIPQLTIDLASDYFSEFPPLYQCSICGKPVKVTPQGEGVEPLKEWKCEHTTATIWANRKVTLRGKGALEAMNPLQRSTIKLKLTVRQLLSYLTNRSI